MKKFFLMLVTFVAIMPIASWAGKTKVLKIDFKNPIEEKQGGSSLDILSLLSGSPSSVTMLSYVQAIDAAAQDKSIGMIYMTPDNVNASVAQIEEIRAALERFKKAGKPIVAYCESMGNSSYYLASVANKIILNTAAQDGLINGVATQMIFLKDLFDALGVDVQLIRHGKYKSAGEMFVNSTASPENRLQNQELINSIWNTLSSEISASRGFSQEQFNSWVENMELCHASDFKEYGLVDELWYKDEVEEYLCKENDVEKIAEVPFVGINKYAAKMKKGSRKNRIAVVYADGEIVARGSDGDVVGSKMVATLKKVREDKKVKAVVFRVNSPGGSAQEAEVIRRELQKLREEKPVIVSFGDYAASGGYWISAEAEKIYSDNTTLTGSIGVFAMIPSVGNAIRKNLKVNIETLGTTSHSDMLTSMRKLNDSEVAYFQKQIEKIYDDFTGLVAGGRGMSKESVDAIGQGRVWSGADALRIGLADEQGGLQDAIDYAANKIGLDSKEYRINQYPIVKEVSLLQMLSGTSDVDPDETLTTGVNDLSPLAEMFPTLAKMRELSGAVIMTRMESVMEIK